MNRTTEYKITDKKSAPRDSIVGTYLRTKMRNFENGYAVFDIRVEDKVITCTGNIIPPRARVTVKVTGIWAETSYGKQLSKCTLREVLSDPTSIYEYVLQAPSVGKGIAKMVADNLDISLEELMKEEDPVKTLREKTGVYEKTANNIIDFIRNNRTHTNLFNMLSRFEGGYAATERLFAAYGDKAIAELVADPYRIGIRYGLEFHACDFIAKSTGARLEDNPRRIAAAAEGILTRHLNDGDCCLPVRTIASATRTQVGNADRPTARTASSNILVANAILTSDILTVDKGQAYLKSLYWQERRSAYAIRRIIRSGIKTECDPDELCTYAEEVCGVKYAEQQREAFRAFQHGGLCVLTGGPGTGKTTVVKGLLVAYEKLYPDKVIKLCAPTGRASQRMKEATGREACTVHRLLEYRPYGDSFSCKTEADPIDADLIVVDESSMISIDMAEMLFGAVRSGTMVLLVGDTAQLPSVGPGNVLADIIRSGVVPVFALTKTHRQGAGSPIIENAKRISAGNHILMQNRDFITIECDEEDIPSSVRSHYIQYHKADDPFAVQILTSTKKDPVNGSRALSKMIQQQVNPTKTGGVRFGDTIFRVGDKVMMTRNNYDVGYFNGDVGLITKTTSAEVTVEINGEHITIPNALLEDMSLAYASTIHKSQGSEYGVVIVVIPSRPISMLQRNILYTAITRARKRVILISSDKTIFTCVNTVTAVQRKTMLTERLQERRPYNP